MKRVHVHVSGEDIDQSVRFYSSLFAVKPTVTKADYAKWMLEDPQVNFGISASQHESCGIEHLGIQVETADELAEVYGRPHAADHPVLEEGVTVCCYAKSDKCWIADPQGVVWEAFHTTGEAVNYGTGPELEKLASESVPRSMPGMRPIKREAGGVLLPLTEDHDQLQAGLWHLAQHRGPEEPRTVEYLSDPPTQKRLVRLMRDAGITARGCYARRGRPLASLGGPALTQEQLVDAMMSHPTSPSRHVPSLSCR